MPDAGNRELLKVIECISGDGRDIPSLIIYKGVNNYIRWHRFIGQDEESKKFWFSYAKKGWTEYWVMNG